MSDLATAKRLRRATSQLPVSWYCDPAVLEAEQRALFPRAPGYVGHELMVPNPGDYYALSWRDNAQVLVRNAQGVELLSNICRHRQAIMLEGRGNAANIVCPIHRWTYDLKGELLGAPHFADKPCLNLGRARLQRWNGLLFDGNRDVGTDLAPVSVVNDFDFSSYMLDRVEVKECNYNWKSFIEVYLEDYHVQPFHPGLGQFVTCADLRWQLGDWFSVQTVGINNGLAKAGTKTYERWHKAVLEYYRGETPKYGAIWMVYYPNVMLEWYPHVLIVSTLIPRAVDRTTNIVEFYYPEDIALFEREFVEAEQAAYLETAVEDDIIAERMDAGRKALFKQGRSEEGPYQSPLEDGMQHFHEFLRRELDAHIAPRGGGRHLHARREHARLSPFSSPATLTSMQSLWMVAAGLCFALMGVFVKIAAPHFATAELVLYRSLLTIALSWGVLARAGHSVRTHRFGMHVHRGVAGFVSLFMFFYALTALPVATAITLNYTSPVFLALLLAVLARERPGTRLLGTIALGFLGVLLLLRPTLQADQLYAGIIGLASGVISAVAYWNVRELVQADEPEGRVVFYFGLISCFGALVWMAPQTWTRLSLDNAWMPAAVGLSGALGQFAMTRAYGKGRPLVSAALSYSSIVFSSLLGIAVWHDVLPLASWLGIVLIIAAGILAVQLAPPAKPVAPPQVTND